MKPATLLASVPKRYQADATFKEKVCIKPDEESRSTVEQQVLLCGRLALWADDILALNERAFVRSVTSWRSPLSMSQMQSLVKILRKYESRFADYGLAMPDAESVAVVLRQKADDAAKLAQELSTKKIVLDVQESQIKLTLSDPKKQLDKVHALRDTVQVWGQSDPYLFTPTYTVGHWYFPKSERVFQLIIDDRFFPLTGSHSQIELTPAAGRYLAAMERRMLDEAMRIERLKAEELAEIATILKTLGDLDGTFGYGKRLFEHQKDGIPYLVRKRYAVLGDQMGIGKTLQALLAAKALHLYYGWKILVISTVNAWGVWEAAAEEFGVTVEMYTWDSIPQAWEIGTDVYTTGQGWKKGMENFILLGDEAHRAKSLPRYNGVKAFEDSHRWFNPKDRAGSQRSLKFTELSLHPSCQATFYITGSPMPNSRPVEMESALLCSRHPLLYVAGDDSNAHRERVQKREYYERHFCVAHRTRYKEWDTSGAAHLEEFHVLVAHKPHARKNHADACMLRRLKEECLDLPDKLRSPMTAEITEETKERFKQELEEAWLRYEIHVQEKLEAKINEYIEGQQKRYGFGLPPSDQWREHEEKKIRQAEALVELMYLRRCSEIAKSACAIDQAMELINEKKHPVIFCLHREVCEEVAQNLHARLHNLPLEKVKELSVTALDIPIIYGGVSAAKRAEIVRDFQAGHYPAIVCSHGAGGESITLVKSQYMLMLSRPWTPGGAEQSEDRIHRPGQTGTVNIYWLQLPKELSDIDIHTDEIVQRKAKGNDLALDGKHTGGLAFSNVEGAGELGWVDRDAILRSAIGVSRAA